MNNTTINKITASWQPLGEKPKVYAKETYRMFQMQKEAYTALKDSPNIIVNAPTASGKTLAICWLTAKKLTDNTSLKAIIAVPQTIIADGFRGPFHLYFEETGSATSWCPREYLCKESISESNIKRIGSFLGREGQLSDINDRILVCSHASLVDAYQLYPELFKDIVIVVDEAHHISYSEGEEVEEVEGKSNMVFCNEMGSIIATALKNQNKNIGLILSTATLFRGDRLEIIPDRHKNKFKTFHYPMDAYLQDMPKDDGINSFSYDFAMYEGRYKKRMTELFKNKVGKTIVYVPHIMSKKYSSGSKATDWKDVYSSISGKTKYETKELDNGITLIKRGEQWIKVVNLVDDSDMSLRSKRKDLIIAAHKHCDSSMIDVIIALNMFKEGANWKWADRELIVGTKGSLTDMNQIIGRLFRYAPNKRHIQTVQLLPFSFDQIDKNKFRENLNEYMKVVFATMLLEEAIAPLQIKLPLKKTKGGGDGIGGGGFVDYLRKQEKDENKIHAIQKAIMIKSIEAQDNGEIDFGCNNKKSRKKFEDITSEVLKNNNITKYHKEISQQIYKSWMRESVKKIKGINLKDVDFDTIQINPLDFMINYTSGMCGLNTFKKFREAVKEYSFLPFDQAREFVRGLGLKNQVEWFNYCKSKQYPFNVPVSPSKVYENEGWISWGDWLGTGRIADQNRTYLSFSDAREFARGLGLKSQNEWFEFCKSNEKPFNISSNPQRTYKNDGWSGFGDFLGTNNMSPSDKKAQFTGFSDAREFARGLGLKSVKEWKDYCKSKRSDKIPSNPNQVYVGQWVSWTDWLNLEYMPFEEAQNFSASLKLKNMREWKEYCLLNQLPHNIPKNPQVVYKNKGWTSWGEWLGNNNICSQKKAFWTFKKARKFARGLGLKSLADWEHYCKSDKKHISLPVRPSSVYKDKGWIGIRDWLGY